MQNSVGQYQQQQIPSSQQISYPQYYSYVPENQSGVHIQIYNPSVAPPGASSVYNVNAPSYATSPYTNPNCYPANYYTEQWGQGYNNPQYPAWNYTANSQYPNGQPTGYPLNGQYPPNNTGVNSQQNNGQYPYNQQYPQQAGVQGNYADSSTVSSMGTNSNKETEKRTIVMLTDDYIKNIENYLNSQDKDVRLMGAKEVAARAMEDPSRCDDKALNALCNKMIQDPDMKVRFLGLSLLYSRNLTGDDYTIGVLQNMQNSTSGYGQDALMASNILLKMSGQTAEKEFEVTSKDKKKKQTEDINKVMTLL